MESIIPSLSEDTKSTITCIQEMCVQITAINAYTQTSSYYQALDCAMSRENRTLRFLCAMAREEIFICQHK